MSSYGSRYFSGKLLDASYFELEQSYFRRSRDPRRETAVWLELDAGCGFEPWYEVADFAFSQHRDRHFILDREQAVIRFGDGARGQAPPVGSGVRGWYRLGAGDVGNLAPTCRELALRLAEVSHFSWMRQKARDDQCVLYEELDPEPTEHDHERAADALSELARIGVLQGDGPVRKN